MAQDSGPKLKAAPRPAKLAEAIGPMDPKLHCQAAKSTDPVPAPALVPDPTTVVQP